MSYLGDQLVAGFRPTDVNAINTSDHHANEDGLSPKVAASLGLPLDVEREAILTPLETSRQAALDVQAVNSLVRPETDWRPPSLSLLASARLGQPARTTYRIITRRESGLPPSRATVDPQQKTHGFVHYTADDGRRRWSQTQAQQRLRGYYNFHVNTQRWADLGYHFVVFQPWFSGPILIFEGRPVTRIPAAQSGYNSGTIAVCVVADANDFAMLATCDAVSWLFWRFKHLNVVGGHRNVVSTSCPGNNFYSRVPEIARRAGCRTFR